MSKENYDIVVIGAGLGGLTAAALLSRKGFKTLIVESRNRVGGRFSTVNYEGFKLTTGAICIHAEGWVVRLMQEIGLDMNLLRPVSRLFYRIAGKDYEIPHKGRLRVILDLVDKAEKKQETRTGSTGREVETEKILAGLKEAVGGVVHEGITTVRDWLLQYTENEKAHEVFDQLCASLLMAHTWELPASNFFRFLTETGGMRDFYIAPQGNLSIAKELARVVEENGAVWTICPARKIVIRGKRATGVVIEKNGKDLEVACEVVISDLGPRMTVELTGRSNFDDEYLRNMRLKLRPSPSVMIQVASDRPLCLEGIPGLLTILAGRRIGGVVPVSSICPELAPSGQHLLYASAEPFSCIHPMDKKYEMQQCTGELKALFPDFEKRGRILNMRPCDVDNEWPEGRTWVGYGMPLETSIPNLFNVGDACLAPGQTGTSGAVETGYRVVDLVEEALRTK